MLNSLLKLCHDWRWRSLFSSSRTSWGNLLNEETPIDLLTSTAITRVSCNKAKCQIQWAINKKTSYFIQVQLSVLFSFWGFSLTWRRTLKGRWILLLQTKELFFVPVHHEIFLSKIQIGAHIPTYLCKKNTESNDHYFQILYYRGWVSWVETENNCPGKFPQQVGGREGKPVKTGNFPE